MNIYILYYIGNNVLYTTKHISEPIEPIDDMLKTVWKLFIHIEDEYVNFKAMVILAMATSFYPVSLFVCLWHFSSNLIITKN